MEVEFRGLKPDIPALPFASVQPWVCHLAQFVCLFVCLFGYAQKMWNFLKQRFNLSHSSNNTKSLTTRPSGNSRKTLKKKKNGLYAFFSPSLLLVLGWLLA